MKPDLYHHGTSVCAAKARFALAEKGVEWNSHIIDIRTGEQRNPEYLKLNPKGMVPTLVHGKNVVIESTVINEYVDEAFSGPPLKPAEPVARAAMRLWTKRLDESVHNPATGTMTFAIALREVYREKLGTPEGVEAYIAANTDAVHRQMIRQDLEEAMRFPLVRKALGIFEGLLEDLEAALSKGPWILGDTFSLADIGYAPYITRLDCLQLDFLWEKRPHVAQWYERLRSRPTYQNAIAQWLVKEEIDVMRENGRKARRILKGYWRES